MTPAMVVFDITRLLLQSDEGDSTLFFLAMFGGGLYFVYSGFRTWQRMRLIQDTPTEKIRSAAAGRTEVEGAGRPVGTPVGRPFGDGDCLVATYTVERYDSDDDGGDWETIDSGTRYGPIQLDDGTGTLVVEPDDETRFEFDDAHVREIEVGGREQEPPEIADFLRANGDVSVPDRDGVTGFLFSERRRYTERWIPVGQQLYVLGGAQPGEPSETNSSGLVLRRDEASGEFIVSAESEDELVTEAKWKAPVKMAGGLAASVAGLYLLLNGGL
ncbi:GIDE domain-containing protein [Haloarcula salinisoli]|uniref:RING-type E3 ubiquitin transferase n=1 Tax=Haloarcula salinisoli TaxID=2487746 RepID=A0A8J7YG14_9EURY|nr:GIDE domain-containing protein [Halomicroarcula salinisoli]MBX0288190.1 E3 ubiquitin ligase family protein [Halomicroarcula salinisoli]MBX0305340.1 E3 ubiquitin ligase family protein [Halomicroarcula salinisoli]